MELGLRMALYECAFVNMLVNSGPASLCILSTACRYLLFKITSSGTLPASEPSFKDIGFPPGSSPPFARPFQKWVWENDGREVLAREFEAMVRIIEETQGSPRRERFASGEL